MNPTRLKCIFVLLILAVIGFGPFSVTGLIGLYVVLRRPGWFKNIVETVYRDRRPEATLSRGDGRPGAVSPMAMRIRCLLYLILLMVLDVAPIPVVSSIGLYVVLRRPDWFKHVVDTLYLS